MKRSPSWLPDGGASPAPSRKIDGVTFMTVSVSAPKSRTLSARRIVLLAGVAGLGVSGLLGGAGLIPQGTGPTLTNIAYAQGVQRPVGFADIVDKVKPAVISVRVKVAAGA